MDKELALTVCVGLIGSLALASAGAAGETTYTMQELENVKTALDGDASAVIPGTAWSVDPDLNRVVVSYDDSVTGAKLAALQSATAAYGNAVRLEHMTGLLEPADGLTVGGQAVYGAGWRCSLGFNTITPNGSYYFITAGHCTRHSLYWNDDDNTTYLGYRAVSYYGGMDYGLVRYTNTTIAKYGAVDRYNGTWQDITTSRSARLNEYTCGSGSTTGMRCGYVRDLCATVTYDDNIRLNCMIKTTACGDHGDSGGPMWSGTAALGIFSGGRLGCGPYPDGPSYFMPVPQILRDHGVNVF